MCELENNLVPTMSNALQEWTRFVDDTFAFIKPDSIQDVLQKLNSYDPKIQFTFEIEKNNTIPLLNVLIKRTENSMTKSNKHEYK